MFNLKERLAKYGKMWKIVFLVLCFVLSVQSESEKPPNSIYVNAVRCNFSEKFVYENNSCFAKSYNRSFSGVNILTTFKTPMVNPYVCLVLSIIYMKFKQLSHV